MASVLKVNILTGVTTAGSIVVTGEGNSTTTSLQQGLAKAWHVYKSTDTFAVLDSLNGASATDHGTGDHSTTVTNAFASVNYANHFSAEYNNSANNSVVGSDNNANGAKTTAALRGAFQKVGTGGADGYQNTVTKHGDLA